MRSGGAPWKRRAFMMVAALIGLAATGAGIQAHEAAHERDSLMPPGRLITVDGVRLHLHCSGSGSPRIILEAGATGFAESWAWIQPELARTNRVCSYDRAGLGWSGKADGGFDARNNARRLHALLQQAGEPGPYIMVGHSLGGALATIYANEFPGDVAAVVAIDPPHPDALDRMPPTAADQYQAFTTGLERASLLAHFGLMRALRPLSAPAATLPPHARRVAAMLESSPAHLARSHAELAEWPTISREFRMALAQLEAPLLVIAAGTTTAARDQQLVARSILLQQEMATTAGGRFVLLPEADHFTIILAKRNAQQVSGMLRSISVQTES